MCNDGIFAIYDHGVIAALIEHKMCIRDRYEAAKDLVPELMGGSDIPWAESDGTAAGSTDAGSPQNTEDDFNNLPAKKASAKDRHCLLYTSRCV